MLCDKLFGSKNYFPNDQPLQLKHQLLQSSKEVDNRGREKRRKGKKITRERKEEERKEEERKEDRKELRIVRKEKKNKIEKMTESNKKICKNIRGESNSGK